MVNPLLFEEIFLYVLLKCMFPLQPDDIFKSETRSSVLSGKSFVCIMSGPSHACLSPVPRIAVHNCKNICNHSIWCNYISLSSTNVESISKPAHFVNSSSDSVKYISKSLKFTPTNSHSINSSTSMFHFVSQCNVHRKCKLH